MYKLIRSCSGYYLITEQYEEESAYFYQIKDNIGMVEVKRYSMDTLKDKCWYAYEALECYQKHFNNKYDLDGIKYCYVVYDKADASFCILGNEIESINEDLKVFDDYYDLINSYPFTFMYS